MIRNTKKAIPSLWKWFIKNIQTSCSLRPQTVQCSTHPRQTANQLTARITNSQHFQISDMTKKRKEDFWLRVVASNHTKCLSAQTSNEEAAADCRNGRMGWWVAGGLIWGQSIDLPSLYLLPAHHAKINGKANSSPPQCGLVNTQLISQSLKLTSQLLTYWYGRHVLNTHSLTHTHTHTPIQTSVLL